MDRCLSVNDWHEHPWEAGSEEGSNVWRIYEIIPDEPCEFVAECETELVTDFIMTAHQALPYWLQEAKERGDREQRLKEEVDKCLIAGNSLASIIVGYELPEGHEEWSHQTASSYFYDTYYNDRKSAYEGYETWLAWKTIRDVSKTLSTLYPDTPRGDLQGEGDPDTLAQPAAPKEGDTE
jgi:hypothetical protein